MASATLHLVPVLAAEKSKVPFYIAGGALALWAVIISLVVGLRRPDFPSSLGGERAVMAVTAVLVLFAAGTAVATSGGAHTATAATVPSASAPASSSPSSANTLTQSADPSGALAFTKPKLLAAAGKVTINFTNNAPPGEVHNLTIAQGTKVLAATPTFQGGTRTLSLNLKPGTYVFYCSVPTHRQAGMQGTLIVR
jgi:plastocyanin